MGFMFVVQLLQFLNFSYNYGCILYENHRAQPDQGFVVDNFFFSIYRGLHEVCHM